MFAFPISVVVSVCGCVFLSSITQEVIISLVKLKSSINFDSVQCISDKCF